MLIMGHLRYIYAWSYLCDFADILFEQDQTFIFTVVKWAADLIFVILLHYWVFESLVFA